MLGKLQNSEYLLLDSGEKKKLEQLGPYRIVRPANEACYRISLPELWGEKVHAIYHRSSDGGGHWEYQDLVPKQFPITIGMFRAYVRLTGFGHIGVFPEQLPLWEFIQQLEFDRVGNVKVLNLFAYTGLSTVACVKKGLSVCHVDSAQGMVELAKENMKLNNLSETAVRWIIEDVRKFVSREKKRGRRYEAFIVDPPAFGRGPKNEVWKLEEHIGQLMEDLMVLCQGKPIFFFLTCYTSGFTPMLLKRILETYIEARGEFLSFELCLKESTGRRFPTGASAMFVSEQVLSPTGFDNLLFD